LATKITYIFHTLTNTIHLDIPVLRSYRFEQRDHRIWETWARFHPSCTNYVFGIKFASRNLPSCWDMSKASSQRLRLAQRAHRQKSLLKG